jgi:glycosyltransferase involved in cell wall biosynthesis
MQPTVSVILPVYNGENYLRAAIDSVFAQTFTGYELIVVDDGSKDSTPEIAGSYGSKLRYVRQDNTGVTGAVNHGLSLVTGKYISWLSHDDAFHPTKLAKQVALLSQHQEPTVCYTDVEFIDSTGKVIGTADLPEYRNGEALRHVVSHELIGVASYSICYDRRCIEEVGFYSTRWPYTQDAEMLMRLARRFPLRRVPERLMQVREHETRGIRSPKWEREVVDFYRYSLALLPFAELFPELGANASRAERSQAYVSLGDLFAVKEFPLYRVAYSQYRRALRENPADAVRMLRRIAGLYRRRRGERN